jgi:hypothetical protein
MQTSGRTESIKEYNIAVEALGRSADFDPKKDSIVRVEAHRLRKRLVEYYQTLGAEDPIEILLPPGTYIPVFHRRAFASPPPVPAIEPSAAEAIAEPPAIESSPIEQPSTPSSGGRTAYLIAAAVAIVAGLFGWSQFHAATPAQPRPALNLAGPVNAPANTGKPLRISVGDRSTELADRNGNLWRTDGFVEGGNVISASPRPIRRTPDPNLYLVRREGDFTYKIPVSPGLYQLQLHFAETVFGEENVAGGGESSRVFGVQVNGGETWIADIISEAGGPNTANIKVYRGVKPASDGSIQIAFRAERKEAPFLNGLEVLPTPNARMLPVRLVAQAGPLTTPAGEEWSSDTFWQGGLSVKRHEQVDGPEPSPLYQGERYGNFSYAIPVATDSTYSVTLRFAESWFGDGAPGAGGVGSRVFDVYCNGRVLLKNFDILKEAGRPLRQVKKTFAGLQPNAQGKLNLQFVPVRNYAMVNAIEVIDEGK